MRPLCARSLGIWQFTIMSKQKNKGKNFWEIGIQYLHLVEVVSNKISQKGNANYSISDKPISLSELEEETKWSDFNLVIPLLFNFYHGIEVLLKGFINLKKNSNSSGHNLSDLLKDFEKFYPKSSLIPLFEKYVETKKLPPILSEFCRASSITIDDYYQALKYPESTKGQKFYHRSLEYKGADGVSFFIDLRNDIDEIRKKSVSLARKENPNA